MRILMAVAAAVTLASCQTAQTPAAQATNETRIATDVPANYRQEAVTFLRGTLKDPYSVRDSQISAPFVGFVGLLNGGNAPVVCVRLNSKNSFGAYTGLSNIALVFKGGKIATAIPDEPMACNNASFAPFPEMQRA